MNYIILSIVLAIAGILSFFFGCNLTHKKANTSDSTGQLPVDTIKGKFTREQIIEKLKALANSEAPTNLSTGAMCYKVAAPPSRAEYVCPICGTKTLYTDDYARIIDREIPQCRTFADSTGTLGINLDEKQFCKKCSPGVKDPQLCIDFKYADDTTKHSVCGINANDMKLIFEFLKGRDKHKDSYDSETPLKNYVGRLKEVLDVKEN
jgi:hypothetical protein